MPLNQFHTVLVIAPSNGDDQDIDVTLDYVVETSSYLGMSYDEVFVTNAVETSSGAYVGDWLKQKIGADVYLQRAILSEWREAQTTDAEIRAELRRDDVRTAA